MRSLTNDLKAHRPVLILPSIAKAFLERCASVEVPLGVKAAELDEMLAAIFGAKPVLEKFPPYAIVPIKGVIGRGLSDMEAACGACDIENVEEMLEDCVRDPAISVIVFDVDSPGGTSVGVPELAKRIRECGKRTIAFTSGDCCSAAYWLASQASEFYATPSSSVGSIGCYIAYHDMKAAFAQEGVTVDVIRAGALKGTGIPGTSLSDEQRAMLQGEVDEIHADFKADVLMVREFASESDMDGRQFSGKKAAEAGLVTALVNGFDELMETLDAEVAAQIEADEANDERAGIKGPAGEPGEEGEEDEGMSRMAAARALGKSMLSSLTKKSEKTPEDEEDDGVESTPKKMKKKSGDEPGQEGEDEEGQMKKSEEADEVEDGAEDEGEEDDGDDDEKDTEPVAEEGDEEKEKPAESEDEDKEDPKASEEAEEKAEEEADSGEKAVETDSEEDKKAKRSRNRSRGIA